MQLLNCRKADIDVVFINALKIFYLRQCNSLPFNIDSFVEEVFCSIGIQEVVPRFSNYVGRINKKEEIAVSFLIKVENQSPP